MPETAWSRRRSSRILDLHDLNSDSLSTALEQQKAEVKPPRRLHELLSALTTVGAT